MVRKKCYRCLQGPPKEIRTSNTRLPGMNDEDVDLAPAAKRVRGDDYDRVATPAFTPGPEQPPPMTWGSLEATPARVVEDDSGPRFHVPQRTSKDLLAHRWEGCTCANMFLNAQL